MDDAHAQAARGSIGVGAIILAPAPGALSSPLHIQLGGDGKELTIRGDTSQHARTPSMIFVRVQLPASSPPERPYLGWSAAAGEELRLQVPDAARSTAVQVERLILAGT